MVRLIALIISIVLQIIAASIALGFMKLTRYRLSWILLSLSFVFMAIRKFIQLFEYFRGTPSFTWQMIDEWIGVLISFMIIVGVILIRELFYSLKKADIDRLRSEKRVINAIINQPKANQTKSAFYRILKQKPTFLNKTVINKRLVCMTSLAFNLNFTIILVFQLLLNVILKFARMET